MTETRARYELPTLAVEEPTAELSLDLLAVNGGGLTFRTDAAHIIGVLRDGVSELTDGDLQRIAELYRAATEELRDRQNGTEKETP